MIFSHLRWIPTPSPIFSSNLEELRGPSFSTLGGQPPPPPLAPPYRRYWLSRIPDSSERLVVPVVSAVESAGLQLDEVKTKQRQDPALEGLINYFERVWRSRVSRRFSQ